MADCSDFRTFAEEEKRMCQSLESQTLCPLKQGLTNWLCDECEYMCFQEIDFAIKTVQEWSDEHPIKTRQGEFLKVFPNACMREDYLVLDVCPMSLDKHFSCEKYITCNDCLRDYWLKEIE